MVRSRGTLVLLLAWAAVVTVVACQLSSDQASPGGAKAATPSMSRPTVSSPLDVAAIRTRFHFAFRRQDDGSLTAAHATHVVHARGGGFSFAPVDWPAPAKGSPSPLVVDAATIARGGAPLAGTAPGEARIDVDGSLVVPRGGAVEERLTNGEHGVEQSWTFSRAPGGAGDLVLRLPVRGEAFVARNESGLHFADAATGRGACYGAAAWVDARGLRTALSSSFDGEAIVLSVPGDVVAESAYPATLDPNVSPEHGIDQPIFMSYVQSLPVMPAVDVEGSRFFAVWMDPIWQGVQDAFGNGPLYGVFGIHVTPSGTPVENAPILIAPGYRRTSFSQPNFDSTSVVSVAFDGQNHLVAYRDQRNGHLAISARRVSAAGVVLDAAPILVSPSSGTNAASPSVAFDGNEFFVVWSDGRNAPASPSDVFASRVSSGGSVLEASSIKVSGLAGNNLDPKVAAGDAGKVYVVWSHDEPSTASSSVYGALLTSSGVILTPDIPIASGTTVDSYFLPAVAGWAGGFAVTYLDSLLGGIVLAPGPSAKVTVAALGADGKPMGSSSLATLENPPSNSGVYMYSAPSVAFDGTRFVVAYSSPGRLNAQSVDTSARLVGTEQFLSINDDENNAPGGAVVAASAASGALAVAHTGGFFGSVPAAIVSVPITFDASGGAILAATPGTLSSGANLERQGVVASDGTNYLVAWTDFRNDTGTQGSDVYAVLLDANGYGVSRADGGVDAGYPLAEAFPVVTVTGSDGPMGIAYDGTGYLVVYVTIGGACPGPALGVAAKRIGTNGQIIGDTAGTNGTYLLCGFSNGSYGDVVWDGTSYLFAIARPNGTGGQQIQAAHVTGTAAGAITLVEGAPVAVSSGTADTAAMVASQGGGNGLIVWNDGSGNLLGRLVADPIPPPAGQTPVIPIATNVNAAAVTYDTPARAYRVGWTTTSGASPIAYASLTPPSTVSAPTPIAGTPTKDLVSMAFDGKASLFVWADQRATAGHSDVYGARIDQTGALLDPQGFPIAADPATSQTPTGIASQNGASLVVYSRYVPGLGDARLVSRVVTEVTNEANGASCTGGGDCASGFCVDRVCCNQACGPCGACTMALGATADGTCTPFGAGRVCRQSSGDCDLSELCDGTQVTCPPDVPAGNGTLCSVGVCENGLCVSSFDAGIDAGMDSGIDAGVDAAEDAANDAAAVDAGDAAMDAGMDSGSDAGIDAGGARDAGADAARDAGKEGGSDAASDAGDSGPRIVVLDAAPPVPASDASFEPFPAASGGCSCRTSTAGDPPSRAGVLALLALLLGRRIRRARVLR